MLLLVIAAPLVVACLVGTGIFWMVLQRRTLAARTGAVGAVATTRGGSIGIVSATSSSMYGQQASSVYGGKGSVTQPAVTCVGGGAGLSQGFVHAPSCYGATTTVTTMTTTTMTAAQHMPAGGMAVDTTGDGRADSIIPMAYGQQAPQVVVQGIPMMDQRSMQGVPMAQPVQAVPMHPP